MASDKRRNSITAVCFLCALTAACAYLALGALPKAGGFLEAALPHRAPADILRSIQRQTEEELAGQRKEKVLPDHPETTRVLHGDVPVARPAPEEDLWQVLNRGEKGEERAEEAVIDLLDREHGFIEIYGAGQRLLGRQVVEDLVDPKYTVVKLTDEVLTFASLEPEQVDMTTRAKELNNFARRVKRRFDIPVLYVQAPSKLDMASLPEGVEDYAGAEADQLLALLRQAKVVDTLDLRPAFREEAQRDPEAVGELFFHTDHHWTPKGAFLAFQGICEKLERWPYRFEIDRDWVDEDNYETYTFDQVFLGSQGKRVGTGYAGTDGIDVWVPRFDTDFTYIIAATGETRKGPFPISLLFPELLAETGLYDTNPYVLYSGGDHLLSRAINEDYPEGKRVLILRDSFGCALTPFLSLTGSEIDAVDPRNFNGDQQDMLDYIQWLRPDVLIIMNTTGSLKVDSLYPYLPTARANVLAERAAKAKEAELE